MKEFDSRIIFLGASISVKKIWQNDHEVIIMSDELVSNLAMLLGTEDKHYYFYYRSPKGRADFALNHRN